MLKTSYLSSAIFFCKYVPNITTLARFLRKMEIRDIRNKLSEFEATLELVKQAQLKKQFLISKEALYDYYSTNSGIIAKNPSIVSGGGGGGGTIEEQIEQLQEETKILGNAIDGIEDAFLNASICADTIPQQYQEIEDLSSAHIATRQIFKNMSADINA